VCVSNLVTMPIFSFFEENWETIPSPELQTARIQFQHMVEAIKDRSIREVGFFVQEKLDFDA